MPDSKPVEAMGEVGITLEHEGRTFTADADGYRIHEGEHEHSCGFYERALIAALSRGREQSEGPEDGPCQFCGGSGYYAAEVGPSRATGPCPRCNPLALREQPAGLREERKLMSDNVMLEVTREEAGRLRDSIGGGHPHSQVQVLRDKIDLALASPDQESERA